MTNRFISPEMINRKVKADKDLNNLIYMLKDDHTTFEYLCSVDYMKKCLLPYYKSTLDIMDIRVRVIDNDIVDVETDKFIITFGQANENVGHTSRYNIVNDIQLATSAEVELESGYMDEMNIIATKNGELCFTLQVP